MQRRFQIFISSTFNDLKEERQAVLKAVLELGHLPAGMELFPASDEAAWRLICEVIDQSDYYVLIVGGRYGSIDENGIGFTEREYDYASTRHKPIIPLLHAHPDDLPRGKTETNPEAWERLNSFRAKVEHHHTCAYWHSPAELRTKLTASIVAAIQKHPAVGWVPAEVGGTTPTFYRNLYEASPAVVRSIKAAITRRHEVPLSVHVLGGRIRTISPMLEQILDDIARGTLRTHDVLFTVCCFTVAELERWDIPAVVDRERFRTRLKAQADELRLHVEELLRYNTDPAFRRYSIRVNVLEYSGFPAIYGFVVGDSDVFFGHYTWNEEAEDFDGPSNPCIHIDRTMSEFLPWHDVLLGRVAFFEVVADEGTRFSHVLHLNRRAYDNVAGDYRHTEPARTQSLQHWLAPLREKLRAVVSEPMTILDVGAGDGLISKHLAEQGYEVTAIDFSHAMCHNLRRRDTAVRIVEGEFLEHDFACERFHCVVAVAVIHLFPPPWDLRVVEKIRSLLDDGGVAFVATTVHDLPGRGFLRKIGYRNQPLRYRRRYLREEFKELLQAGGFSVQQSYDTTDPVRPDKHWMNFILTP